MPSDKHRVHAKGAQMTKRVLCSMFCVLVHPNATEAATEHSGQEPVSDLDFD